MSGNFWLKDLILRPQLHDDGMRPICFYNPGKHECFKQLFFLCWLKDDLIIAIMNLKQVDLIAISKGLEDHSNSLSWINEQAQFYEENNY